MAARWRKPRAMACLLLAAAVSSAVLPDELAGIVSPLDAAPDVGEVASTEVGEKTGGFFSALMTSGSFVMMQVRVLSS